MIKKVITFGIKDPVSGKVTQHRFVIAPLDERWPNQPWASLEVCTKDKLGADAWMPALFHVEWMGLILNAMTETAEEIEVIEKTGVEFYHLGELVLPDPRED